MRYLILAFVLCGCAVHCVCDKPSDPEVQVLEGDWKNSLEFIYLPPSDIPPDFISEDDTFLSATYDPDATPSVYCDTVIHTYENFCSGKK